MPTAAAAAVALTGNLELRARMGVHGKYGDDYCAAGMDVAARRTLATRATAAAVKAGEVRRSMLARCPDHNEGVFIYSTTVILL